MAQEKSRQVVLEDEGWRKVRNHSWRTVGDAAALPLAAPGPPPGPPPAAAPVAAVDGLARIRGALSAAECAALVQMAEGCGFDNARHEAYQDGKLDKQEERFRRNHRVVYEASAEQCRGLFARLVAGAPPEIDAREEYFADGKAAEGFVFADPADAAAGKIGAEEYGVWRPEGVNPMWRFYRYDPALRQQFPTHKDNSTRKRKGRVASWLTVLVYLSGGGCFKGGTTAFTTNPFCEDVRTLYEVEPQQGDVAMFFHHGRRSPWHAGTPVTGGEGMKYVLRTDVMYRAVVPARKGPTHMLSAPYDSSYSDSDSD